ncbi:MAG TPA: SUMF1/EgtB/PvdO family nonheme iron enzyme [Polyangiaceae bacterium]
MRRLPLACLAVLLASSSAWAQFAARRQEPIPVGPVSPPTPACGEGMALVEGDYCPVVHEHCLEWMEKPSLGGDGRCARFAPSECAGDRVRSRFCIDRDEYTAPGDALPMNFVSWSHARVTCEADGKRLCLESEWNFACEGEAMLPYPTGLERDDVHCNFDRMDLYDARGRPRDLRLPAALVAGCVSPFGVRSLVGNVDEWVERDATWGRWRSALKGGWWLAARNRCRPATTAHDQYYNDFQTGFRCCSDARPA